MNRPEMRTVMLKAAEQVRTRVWRGNFDCLCFDADGVRQALDQVCGKLRNDIYSSVCLRVWNGAACILTTLVGCNWHIDAARVDAVRRETERKENE